MNQAAVDVPFVMDLLLNLPEECVLPLLDVLNLVLDLFAEFEDVGDSVSC